MKALYSSTFWPLIWQLFWVLFCVNAVEVQAALLPLDSFSEQVRSYHSGYLAARETSYGAKLQSAEADLLFHPQFLAEGQVLSDARPQLNSFVPQKTDQKGLTLGITQQLPLGIQAKLLYQFSHIQLDIPPSTAPFFNVRSYYDAIPSLDFTIPLWRGRGGTEFESTQALVQSSKLATHYQEAFRARMILLEAERSYWRLALAREAVEIQKQVLKRAQSLEDWARKRRALRLGDTSDLLQSQASRHYRELELKTAQDEERMASQAFNAFRGEEPRSAIPSLSRLKEASTKSPDMQEFSTYRSDLQAAEQIQKQAYAGATEAVERNRPQIDLFASLSLNGRAQSASDAVSRGWDFDRKTSVIGVRVASTLDFWNRWEVKWGAAREREASIMAYDRKRFEYHQEWLDLHSRLKEAQSRLKLTQSLVSLQIAQLEREQDQLRRGRSTTFQVIQFENDSATSQISALRALLEVIQITAELRTFSPREHALTKSEK